VGEDKIVTCSKCGYEGLYSTSTANAKIPDFFNTEQYEKLMSDLDVITSKDDFVSLIGMHSEVKELMDIYLVQNERFSKKIVIPKGRSFF
jgi:predicted nucleic-acid-binding Zn-ribbon protein